MESNSRRSFLQLAATLGALAPAAGKAAAQPAAPTLPTVKFGKFEITHLIVGSNPLYGYSHFNHTMDQLMREWYTQDRKMEVLHACERQGINTWQLHYNDQPIEALDGAVTKIPQRCHEERNGPLLVEACGGGFLEPAGGEAAPERCQLFQAHRLGRRRYEGALSWASNGQPLLLEIAVGLEHGVGVDRERGDNVLHPWQLVDR